MAIHYRLEENNFKPGTFYARVLQGDKVTLQQMLPNIVAKTALSGTDVKASINALIEEIIALLAAGKRVEIDGLVRFTTSISGNFAAHETTLSQEAIQLNIVVQDVQSLKVAVSALATYQQEVSGVKTPVINTFFDVASKSYGRYTAGSIVSLKGTHLNFNEAADDEGIFVNDGHSETRLTVYSFAGRKQIDALIPPSINGPLTVTVRTRYTSNGTLRQGSYQKDVTPL